MVYLQIKELMENARKQVSVQINNILVQTYWEIEKIIVEDEQSKEMLENEVEKVLGEYNRKKNKKI